MNSKFKRVLPCAVAASAAAASLITAGPALAETPVVKHAVVIKGLQSPWDMAFLPDKTMFFTEKCDGVSVRMPSGDVNKLVGMEKTEGYADTAEDLFCDGQAGMAGVAVDPKFAENRQVYVYSTSRLSSPPTNRVMRFKVSDDFTKLTDRTDIVADIPYKPKATDHPFGDSGAHNGGRMRFNPGDGFLFVTTGDNHNGAIPQSPTQIGGKVLRIDTDGKAAADNAPPEGFDKRVYTYGHRNPQGITFRPGTNQPFTAENGPWHSDEVTALKMGGNAGWDPRPKKSGRSDCPDNYCGYEPKQMEAVAPEIRSEYMPMTDLELYPDAMKPAWNNEKMSQGMSSGVFLSGDKWKDWDGRMAVGMMGIGVHGTPVGNRIDILDISEDGQSSERTTIALPMPAGRFRSVVQGPDGDLYTATDEGEIYQLTPQ